MNEHKRWQGLATKAIHAGFRPDPGTGAFGLFSGIDDYYMDFLVDRVAQAAVQATKAAGR